MSIEVVSREPLELVGLETRASNADPSPIGELWGRFLAAGPRTDLVAVYCEYEGDHTQPYTFFLGRRAEPGEDPPDGWVRRRVEGGAFARFLAEGEQPGALIETWQRIWTEPLARTYRADVELHPADDPTRVEILVGVQS